MNSLNRRPNRASYGDDLRTFQLSPGHGRSEALLQLLSEQRPFSQESTRERDWNCRALVAEQSHRQRPDVNDELFGGKRNQSNRARITRGSRGHDNWRQAS